MVGAFAPEAVAQLATALDALAAVAQGSQEERLQAAAAHLVTDAQSEIDRLRAIEAKFAACVGLVGELEPGHAHLCPRGHAGWGHCRCICDFEARAALRRLAGLA